MTHYFGLILFSGFAVLQASVLGELTASLRLRPDLMLLLVISWSLSRGPREGLLWAFAGGLFVDLLSNAPLGANALALTAVAAAIGMVQADIARRGPTMAVLCVFPATLLHGLLLLLVAQALGQQVAWLSTAARIVLPTALLNTIVMPIVYLAARGMGHFLHHEVPVER